MCSLVAAGNEIVLKLMSINKIHQPIFPLSFLSCVFLLHAAAYHLPLSVLFLFSSRGFFVYSYEYPTSTNNEGERQRDRDGDRGRE
jgi:hypothetical protein